MSGEPRAGGGRVPFPDNPTRVARGLVRAQKVLLEGDEADLSLLFRNTLSRDVAVRNALFASFETGFHLSINVLEQLARLILARHIPASWQADDAFNDDSRFSPDRFFLTFAVLPVNDVLETAGVAQARRLLATGMLDPAYLTSLAGMVAEFGDELMVYMPERARNYRQTLTLASGIQHQSAHAARQVAEATAHLAWIEAERNRVFTTVWLPNMLSVAEAAAIRDLPVGYVRELYPTQYAAGYAGYRAMMLAKGGAA